MNDRQHVWVGPDATQFEATCELCGQPSRPGTHPRPDGEDGRIAGTLRPEADVGFTSCRRGHRVVVRRVGRLEWETHAA